MEFPGGGGSTVRPSGTENPGGWGGQTGKTLRGGGVWIFSGTTQSNFFLIFFVLLTCKLADAFLQTLPIISSRRTKTKCNVVTAVTVYCLVVMQSVVHFFSGYIDGRAAGRQAR